MKEKDVTDHCCSLNNILLGQ